MYFPKYQTPLSLHIKNLCPLTLLKKKHPLTYLLTENIIVLENIKCISPTCKKVKWSCLLFFLSAATKSVPDTCWCQFKKKNVVSLILFTHCGFPKGNSFVLLYYTWCPHVLKSKCSISSCCGYGSCCSFTTRSDKNHNFWEIYLSTPLWCTKWQPAGDLTSTSHL